MRNCLIFVHLIIFDSLNQNFSEFDSLEPAASASHASMGSNLNSQAAPPDLRNQKLGGWGAGGSKEEGQQSIIHWARQVVTGHTQI